MFTAHKVDKHCMIIELGNDAPGQKVDAPGPAVTTIGIEDTKNEDGSYVSGYVTGTDVQDVLRQYAVNRGGVMRFGGNEAIQDVIGCWNGESATPPAWVNVIPQDRDPDNAEDLERILAEYWGAERGKPADVEDNYYTEHDNLVFAPGEAPE